MTMSSSGSEMPGGGGPRKREVDPDLTSSDPYAVLGLERNASAREIKRTYFDLVREYPPEERPEEFKRIRAAYEKLRTGQAKAETDLFLVQPPEAWEPRKRQGKLELGFDPADIWLLLRWHGDLGRTDFEDDLRAVRV